jgi:ribosomal protein L16 Arg81 hydroxylase
MVHWSHVDEQRYPGFHHTTVNEVVLHAGDVLYLPTFWFHHIVSLTTNYQCNTRSGYSVEYD